MRKIDFKDKHIRYGGYGAVLTLVVIAIVIIANIIVTSLNMKLDMSSEKIYSLSDTTKELTKDMDVPINIYVLEQTNKERKWLQDILMKYPKVNKQIKVIYKDPVLYPNFGASYLDKTTQNIKTLNDGTIIVENEASGKFKIVPPSELMVESSGSAPGSEGITITVESAITNAIGYVLTDKDGGVYYTTGHNELTLSPYFLNSCDRANLSLNPLNLLTEPLPDPANSALVINSPQSDFSTDEVDKILEYMQNGGKAIIFMDVNTSVLQSGSKELPVFSKVLDYYGVEHKNGLVIEADAKNIALTSPTFLLPNRGKHDILKGINTGAASIIFPSSSGFMALSDARTSLKITPLLTTSKDAFLRTDVNEPATTKLKNDLDGPFTLSYAIEDTATGSDTDHTKLVVIGTTACLSNKYISVAGNQNFITSALGWLLSVDTSYSIPGKTQDVYALKTLTMANMLLICVLLMIVIPLIVIIIGICVLIRRRHA